MSDDKEKNLWLRDKFSKGKLKNWTDRAYGKGKDHLKRYSLAEKLIRKYGLSGGALDKNGDAIGYSGSDKIHNKIMEYTKKGNFKGAREYAENYKK